MPEDTARLQSTKTRCLQSLQTTLRAGAGPARGEPQLVRPVAPCSVSSTNSKRRVTARGWHWWYRPFVSRSLRVGTRGFRTRGSGRAPNPGSRVTRKRPASAGPLGLFSIAKGLPGGTLDEHCTDLGRQPYRRAARLLCRPHRPEMAVRSSAGREERQGGRRLRDRRDGQPGSDRAAGRRWRAVLRAYRSA